MLLFTTIGLMVIGILFIYSSGVSSNGAVLSHEYLKQIVWAGTGLVLLFAIAMWDYTRLRDWSGYIYGIFVFLLVLTLVIGKRINGARSWLGLLHLGVGIQPSEFAKIGTILLVGNWLASNRERAQSLTVFLGAFGIALVPILLILAQPDLGTALVYVPIVVVMTYVSGTKRRYVLFVLLTAGLLAIFSLMYFWRHAVATTQSTETTLLLQHGFIKYILLAITAVLAVSAAGLLFFKRRYFYWIVYGFSSLFFAVAGTLAASVVLKPYQVMRLISFLDPQLDPRSSGWNIIQSVTAVGSGGFWGKGLLHGTQSHYNYLPQQSTDFIFSIFSEEWGFIGGVLLFGLFLIVFIRGLRIVANAKEPFAIAVGSGVIGMIFFHFIVNVGMAMGIMPITGIPLTFLSYGGSSLWTALTGIGILINIHHRRYS